MERAQAMKGKGLTRGEKIRILRKASTSSESGFASPRSGGHPGLKVDRLVAGPALLHEWSTNVNPINGRAKGRLPALHGKPDSLE
jgi:hypothetical protein